VSKCLDSLVRRTFHFTHMSENASFSKIERSYQRDVFMNIRAYSPISLYTFGYRTIGGQARMVVVQTRDGAGGFAERPAADGR